MIIVAFDPGRTTGVCIGEVTVQDEDIICHDCDEFILKDDLYSQLYTLCEPYTIDMVLMESIVAYGRLNWDKIDQVQAYTHVLVTADMLNVPVQLITPEERKRGVFIGSSGVPSELGHARDAAKLIHVWVQQM